MLINCCVMAIFVKSFILFLTVFTVINCIPMSSVVEQRIVGGVDAPEAYAPHMAGLIHGVRVKAFMCGGSIISRSLVLTAAHCIDPFIQPDGSLLPSFRITVGSNQWNSGGIIVQIRTFHNHPLWDPVAIKHDAGFILLEEKLVFSPYVMPVALGFDVVRAGQKCSVTGWGGTGPRIEDNVVNLQPTPDNMQVLNVTTVTHHECELGLRAVAGQTRLPAVQDDIEICTFHSVGHGMCVGDSGSALVMMNTRHQIGIVSWGVPCAHGAPDVFVRISGIRNFLKDIMNIYRG